MSDTVFLFYNEEIGFSKNGFVGFQIQGKICLSVQFSIIKNIDCEMNCFITSNMKIINGSSEQKPCNLSSSMASRRLPFFYFDQLFVLMIIPHKNSQSREIMIISRMNFWRRKYSDYLKGVYILFGQNIPSFELMRLLNG